MNDPTNPDRTHEKTPEEVRAPLPEDGRNGAPPVIRSDGATPREPAITARARVVDRNPPNEGAAAKRPDPAGEHIRVCTTDFCPTGNQGRLRSPKDSPTVEASGETQRTISEFAADFAPLPAEAGSWDFVDAILKKPASLVYMFVHGTPASLFNTLALTILCCLAVYGGVMGSFSGGEQYWIVPGKLLVGLGLSALLCLPSLYIFSSLGGSSQGFLQTARLLGLSIALQGILLVGFAPIAWVFSQSTSSVAFMGLLHIMLWAIAVIFSLRLLVNALTFLNKRSMGILHLWSFLFVVVALQMSTTLRPLVGPAGPRIFTPEKKFFLTHWGHCITGSDR